MIADVVKNSGAGRLILGTHGRRGLKKFVLGSVARQLLETVDIPVCTVGPRAHRKTTDNPADDPAPGIAGRHARNQCRALHQPGPISLERR